MANIYDFLAGFKALWSLIEDEEVDDAVIEDCFANMTEDLKDKLENCCKYIKNQEAVIAGLKEEEKRLSAKRKSAENAVERLKKLMQLAMTTAGEKKLPCGTFTVSLQKNPESVVMDEQYIENIPEEYLKYKEPEIDRAKIKEHLKAGVNLEGIAHLEQSEGLRIR